MVGFSINQTTLIFATKRSGLRNDRVRGGVWWKPPFASIVHAHSKMAPHSCGVEVWRAFVHSGIGLLEQRLVNPDQKCQRGAG